MEELVSIVTPMYNSGKYILSTIKSVLAQEYKNWELLIVDDCSFDNSRKIVKSYASKDPRIVLIKQNVNQGTAAARNKALELSKGRFIAFLDSDDLWKPNKLRRHIEFMKEKKVAFTYSAFEKINNKGEKLNIIINVPLRINYKRLLKCNVIQCLTVVIDKHKICNFSMPSMRYEDYSTWLNILKKERYAYGINESLAMYRVTDNSYSSNKIKAIGWIWNVYRNDQKLSPLWSLYYIINFTVLTTLKYLRITNLFFTKTNLNN